MAPGGRPGARGPVRVARGLLRRARETGRPARPVAVSLRAAVRPLVDALPDGARVGVLAPGSSPPFTTWVTRHRPDLRVDVLPARRPLVRLHRELAARGPYDLLVDTGSGAGSGPEERLRELCLHCRTGGAYVVALPGPRRPQDRARLLALVDELARLRTSEDLLAPQPGGDRRRRTVKDRHALALSTTALGLGPSVVAVRVEIDTLPKLDPAGLSLLEALRPQEVTTLATLPATRLTRENRVTTNRPPSPVNPLPATYDVPPLSLRRHAGVLCLPRQGLVQGRVVLPDSYIAPTARRLRGHAFQDWSRLFVRDDTTEAPSLPGPWFHLDSEYRGHFGHALTEQVSRLWGWPQALREHPGIRVLMTSTDASTSLARWEEDLWAAAGIDPARITVAPGPVRVETLVTCSPMFARPDYVHPEIVRTWDALGARLAGGAAAPGSQRVFLSRRGTKRRCVNGAVVEQRFRDAGFQVVLPEDLPLGEQVALVRGAEVVAGYAGSAMFHTALSGRPQRVLVVGSEAYPAHNEFMIAAVRGHDLTWLQCPPRTPRPPGRGFSLASFHSDYDFDEDRDGAFLDSALAALGPP